MSRLSHATIKVGRSIVSERKVVQAVERYRAGDGHWPANYGPAPSEPRCQVPAHLLDGLAGPATFVAPGHPGRKPFVLRRLGLIAEPPPRREILGGIAAAGELVALAGQPAAGKSAVAVLLAASIASGTPFLGRPVERGVAVYVAAERYAETLRRLKVAAEPNAPILLSGDRPALGEAQDVSELVEVIRQNVKGAPFLLRLIILDTAARCFRGLRENSSDDIGIAAEALARIGDAFPTAFILLVHHTTKAGDSMRGSSALLGAVDVELTVDRRGDERWIEVTAAKVAEEGQRLAFRLEPVPFGDGPSVVRAFPVTSLLRPSRGGSSEAAPRLPRDAATALAALIHLAGGGSVEIEAWRQMTFERWSDRRQGTRRQAFSKARDVLSQRGLILVNGESVSVSDASAGVSADGAKASAPRVSAGGSIGAPADVADDADDLASGDAS